MLLSCSRLCRLGTLITIICLSWIAVSCQQYTEEGRPLTPLDAANTQHQAINLEEERQVVEAIITAENALRYPFQDAKPSQPFGEPTVLFSEEFQTKTDVYNFYLQYWTPNLAEQLANEVVDLSNSRADIGLAGHTNVEWKSIFDADPTSLRVTHFNDLTAVVDLLIRNEGSRNIRLQYSLVKDTREQRWRIASKTLLDTW